MTRNRWEKRQVRARMARTGESYQKALLAILAGQVESVGPLAGQLSPREQRKKVPDAALNPEGRAPRGTPNGAGRAQDTAGRDTLGATK